MVSLLPLVVWAFAQTMYLLRLPYSVLANAVLALSFHLHIVVTLVTSGALHSIPPRSIRDQVKSAARKRRNRARYQIKQDKLKARLLDLAEWYAACDESVRLVSSTSSRPLLLLLSAWSLTPFLPLLASQCIEAAALEKEELRKAKEAVSIHRMARSALVGERPA